MRHAIEHLLIALIGLGLVAIIAGAIIGFTAPYAALGLILSGSAVSSLGIAAGDSIL